MPRRSEAEKIVSGFAGLKILVLGDFMLDQFVWGRVQRISPEAPVPVVNVERESLSLGGAGNVVLNLCAVGSLGFTAWLLASRLRNRSPEQTSANAAP